MIEMIVEGKGLEPILRQMKSDPAIRVIGPHISGHYPGAQIEGQRIAVRVNAGTAAQARDLIRKYLPPDGNYIVRPALAPAASRVRPGFPRLADAGQDG